ncbi:response regulator transcription factor [Nocardiopsis aegyptia]|uniref:response regulator transcription factor n=1 Tax=Nocardiopsis aegyptia TaxID=220378 RepID=UPI00366B9C9D
MFSQTPRPRTTTADRTHAFVDCGLFPVPEYDGRALEALSRREREVLRGLGRGFSNRRIARDLGVTERTVKAHVTRILEKLSVRSRLEAALVVITQHWDRYHRSGGSACGCGLDGEAGPGTAREGGAPGGRSDKGEALADREHRGDPV